MRNFSNNPNVKNSFKKTDNNKKFDFKKKKDNTIKSLTEVENFLKNIKNISRYIKLYKIVK